MGLQVTRHIELTWYQSPVDWRYTDIQLENLRLHYITVIDCLERCWLIFQPLLPHHAGVRSVVREMVGPETKRQMSRIWTTSVWWNAGSASTFSIRGAWRSWIHSWLTRVLLTKTFQQLGMLQVLWSGKGRPGKGKDCTCCYLPMC